MLHKAVRGFVVAGWGFLRNCSESAKSSCVPIHPSQQGSIRSPTTCLIALWMIMGNLCSRRGDSGLAEKRVMTGPINLTQDPHQGQTVRLAGEPLDRARAAMLMVHGRGANAEDILVLAGQLAQPGIAYL